MILWCWFWTMIFFKKDADSIALLWDLFVFIKATILTEIQLLSALLNFFKSLKHFWQYNRASLNKFTLFAKEMVSQTSHEKNNNNWIICYKTQQQS